MAAELRVPDTAMGLPRGTRVGRTVSAGTSPMSLMA